MTRNEIRVAGDKKKNRFNFVDLSIVIVALLVLAVFAYVIFLGSGAIGKTRGTDIEYTLRIRNIRGELAEKIAEGDAVSDAERYYAIGKVKSITTTPARKATGEVGDGSLLYEDSENFVDVYITIDANAVKTDNGYNIGGYDIRVGKNVCIRTYSFTNGTGWCTAIGEVTAK